MFFFFFLCLFGDVLQVFLTLDTEGVAGGKCMHAYGPGAYTLEKLCMRIGVWICFLSLSPGNERLRASIAFAGIAMVSEWCLSCVD